MAALEELKRIAYSEGTPDVARVQALRLLLDRDPNAQPVDPVQGLSGEALDRALEGYFAPGYLGTDPPEPGVDAGLGGARQAGGPAAVRGPWREPGPGACAAELRGSRRTWWR
jgi:hypothetical protein